MDALAEDYFVRRQSLQAHVQHFQRTVAAQAENSDTRELERLLAETSSSHSQATRLYARVAAVVLADSLED